MDSRAKELLKQGDYLFSKRQPLLSLWQEIGDHFYPERSEFTVTRSLGEDFAEGLSTSYPLLARRELGNAFSAMLRPTSKEWFAIQTTRPEREDNDARAWLQWASGVQRRAMFDRDTAFVKATKLADHDFATWGQCVLTVDLDREINALLYRAWHLRDTVWSENVRGEVDTVHRKWKPTARDLVKTFGDKVHAKVKKLVDKDPYCELECRHVVIPSGEYETEKGRPRQPYVSVYLDVENSHLMEEVPTWRLGYIIPRWQTVGTQYAVSPATVAALPDARLIQAMIYSLLQATEKAATPPMIAVREALRSDVHLFPGGVTYVDESYDERLGEVLRPVTQDKDGIPLGVEVSDRIQNMIAQAFFLNKLNMPPPEREMTAYEVGQRMQEYIRQAMPVFEPMETEYNGALCEETFDILLRGGAFGALDDMPESLQGADVQCRFESPLQEASEKVKGQRFVEAGQMLAQAVQLDPGAAVMLDARTALRDALNGIGVPAQWMRSGDDIAAIEAAQAQAAQSAALLQTIGAGAEVAANMGKAAKDFAGAQAARVAV